MTTNILNTIETDLASFGKWLETEAEDAAQAVWGVIKVVFSAAEPSIVNNVVTALKTFLTTMSGEVATGTPLETLEQNFLQWAEIEGKSLLQDVETLGSTLVQALIALTVKSLPAAA